MSDGRLARGRLRPAEVPAEREAAVLGLVADTHLGDRGLDLPPALFDLFRGVDLVLHAGDVGVLATIDRLSAVAPVVAVHGNDEVFDETPRELPYQQVVALRGQRILLIHGHYPDLAEEMASRREDRWQPKLDRWAAFGHRAGAQIVVYGHTHVAAQVQHDGVWLINPGALASGGLHTRMRHRTAALLYLRDDGLPFTVHVDLAAPERPFVPQIDWPAGFIAVNAQYEASILAPDLEMDYRRLRDFALSQGAGVKEAIRLAVQAVSMRCWTGEQALVTRADLLAAIEGAATLPAEARREALALLGRRS